MTVMILNYTVGFRHRSLNSFRCQSSGLKFTLDQSSVAMRPEIKQVSRLQAQLSPDAIAQQFRRDSVGLLSTIKYQLTAVPSIILSTIFGVHLHSGKLSNIILSLSSMFGFGPGLMAMSLFGTTSILAIELTKMLSEVLLKTWTSSSSLLRLVGVLFRRG